MIRKIVRQIRDGTAIDFSQRIIYCIKLAYTPSEYTNQNLQFKKARDRSFIHQCITSIKYKVHVYYAQCERAKKVLTNTGLETAVA